MDCCWASIFPSATDWPPPCSLAADSKLNAFVHIDSDDSVTLFLHKVEMGQGVVTSLSQLLGEELGATGKRSGPGFAPVDMAYGPLQGTFGSMSIRTSWDPLPAKAGASARRCWCRRLRKNGASIHRNAAPEQ